jgi:hypothetical protein
MLAWMRLGRNFWTAPVSSPSERGSNWPSGSDGVEWLCHKAKLRQAFAEYKRAHEETGRQAAPNENQKDSGERK